MDLDSIERRDRLAELVAGGVPLHEAGHGLGLTRGQTAAAWRSIRNDLGAQAC